MVAEAVTCGDCGDGSDECLSGMRAYARMGPRMGTAYGAGAIQAYSARTSSSSRSLACCFAARTPSGSMCPSLAVSPMNA